MKIFKLVFFDFFRFFSIFSNFFQFFQKLFLDIFIFFYIFFNIFKIFKTFFTIQSFINTIFTRAQDLHLSLVWIKVWHSAIVYTCTCKTFTVVHNRICSYVLLLIDRSSLTPENCVEKENVTKWMKSTVFLTKLALWSFDKIAYPISSAIYTRRVVRQYGICCPKKAPSYIFFLWIKFFVS